MTPIEFVKKFGWDRAKREVALIGTIAMMCGDNDFNNDLKRLVESYELVKKMGGLNGAINSLSLFESSLAIGLYHGVVGVNTEAQISELKKAIADVESCQ